ncbi:PPE domain-containing protein [Mycolicibacterium gadium]|jgi:hypothetical protein|uniref:PPE domain-containing protein n=1 Tax=Mycolicibacterium gadium TaxID=1794 RepID=UPI002FDD27F6
MSVQRVNPGSLISQAAEMKGQNWHNPAEDAVAPPDAVPSTVDAIANLNQNARSLKEFEEWAKVENQRIAEMLEIAAQAYQKVDDEYGIALDNPERAAAVDTISIPSPPTPAPEIPSPADTPRLLDASGYRNVIQTQIELSAPDTGASLKNAMLYWSAASNRVKGNKPKPPPGDWEGDAADAAYARMTAFGNWLAQLSQAWHDLAEAASKILNAHETAKAAHAPIYDEYVALEARIKELAGSPGPHAGIQRQIDLARRRLEELQALSDEVRQQYAGEATFTPVRPADPPFKPTDSFAPGAGGGGGGGDQPAGDPAATAQQMGESMGTSQQQAGAGQGGGSGGGSPSGGEPPSGAGPSGVSPGGSEGEGPQPGTPRATSDPSLRPAAGGGSGGGSGGGAGGGGSAPLSPAVSAETVAPAPPVPIATAPAAAASAPGGMAGGMGGMAPMHGGHGAQQGKEKRRDPRTAPDEDLYVEDRPWTEGVVGNRRRREVQDGGPRAHDDEQDDDE